MMGALHQRGKFGLVVDEKRMKRSASAATLSLEIKYSSKMEQ